MGFNYNEYVKRGNNPLLLEEEMNPEMPPASKSGLRIWLKQYYKISSDDIETLFLENPTLIGSTEWRTAKGIEASLKRADIPFERKATTNTADNDTAAAQDQTIDYKTEWNQKSKILTNEFKNIRNEIEEKYDVDINVYDQQDFLKMSAYKAIGDPSKDFNLLYKQRLEAMEVYFKDNKVDVEKLQEDFKDFLRDRGYGGLEDVGPENRPDDYKQDTEQPEQPQQPEKEVKVAKEEIVKDLTDRSKTFNLSEKIDSIASYITQKSKSLFPDLDEIRARNNYERFLKSIEENLETQVSIQDETINDIYNKLFFLKFIEDVPQVKAEAFLDNPSDFDSLYLSLKREVYRSDAIGIAKGLKENLEEPQLSQVLDLIYNNLDSIALQEKGWENSDNIISSIFSIFKSQTGLNLQDYLPSDININIPATAYEGRVEELEEFLPEAVLTKIESLTSSNTEYKEVLSQYINLRNVFEGYKDYKPGSEDSVEVVLPATGSEGEEAILKEIVEFVSTPHMPFNDYAFYWSTRFTGSFREGLGNPAMKVDGENDEGTVIQMLINEVIKTINPEKHSEISSLITEPETIEFINNYVKFNTPITKQNTQFYKSIPDNFPTLGNKDTSLRFENNFDMLFEGLLPALNRFLSSRFGADLNFLPFNSAEEFTVIRGTIQSLTTDSERNRQLILDIIEKDISVIENNIKLKNKLIDSYEKALDSIEGVESEELQNAAQSVVNAIAKGDIDAAERAQTILSMKIAEQNGVGLIEKLQLWNRSIKEREMVEQLEMLIDDIKKLEIDDINFNIDYKQPTQDIDKAITTGMSDDETDLPGDSDDDIDVDPLQELIKGSISSLLLEVTNNSQISFVEVMNYTSLINLHTLTSQRIFENQIDLFNSFESVERSKDKMYSFLTNEFKNDLNLINNNKIPSFESTKFYQQVELALVQIKYLEQINKRIENKFKK